MAEEQKPNQHVPARFDEGESKPAPIERTGHDNVRSTPPSSPAVPDGSKPEESGEDLDPNMTD